MKILRTIAWVVILFGVMIFSIYNWKPAEVMLWQNLVLETKLPVLVVLAFLLGFVPIWAYHSSVKWRLGRRIRTLENSLKTTALARRQDQQDHASAPDGVERAVEKSLTKSAESHEPLAPDGATGDGAGE